MTFDELIERGDLDELTRAIDGLCEQRDWDGLFTLRDRCRAALERGKQLWPAAVHAEYRLALEAPGPWAGRAVAESSGRFALGPLSEVAASTHEWADLREHVGDGPARIVTAHERVVRGEDLTGEGLVDDVYDLPFVVSDWEGSYPVATYHPDRAEFPAPDLPALDLVDLPPAAPTVDEPDETTAFADLTRAWSAESNGRTQVVAVEGDALGAIAALGPERARVAPIASGEAMAALAWAAASGGAHGRRRGMAAGRFGARWVVSTLADDPAELQWYAWDVGEPPTGWNLHLAAERPDDGAAWAVSAVDQHLV